MADEKVTEAKVNEDPSNISPGQLSTEEAQVEASKRAAETAFGNAEANEDGTVNPEYGVPNADGFVGVGAEYANYANETDKPFNEEEADKADESKKEEPKKAPAAKPTSTTK